MFPVALVDHPPLRFSDPGKPLEYFVIYDPLPAARLVIRLGAFGFIHDKL